MNLNMPDMHQFLLLTAPVLTSASLAIAARAEEQVRLPDKPTLMGKVIQVGAERLAR